MEDFQLNFSDKTQTYLKLPLRLVLDDVCDLQNIGMLYRLADALCVEEICHCGDSPTPPSKKISRTARAADRHVPFSYQENVVTCIENLKSAGYQIFALEITKNSRDISTVPFGDFDKIALVVGAEFNGVSEQALARVDGSVHIPMHGIGFSMNVATSVAIGLYDIVAKLKAKK